MTNIRVNIENLSLSNSPLCVCVCVCVHYIFFIHSLVDRCRGCFHFLAVVSRAAKDTGVHVPSGISVVFSSDKYPVVELLDHRVVLLLAF